MTTAELFAQTGANDDDLFDDVVAEESMRIRSDDDLFSDDFTPAPEPVLTRAAPQLNLEPAAQAPRGPDAASRARGRGRGRGRASHDVRNQSRGEHDGQSDAAQYTRGEDSRAQKPSQAEGPVQKAAPPIENAPTGPRREGPTSVRGDRHATGGVRKPKLTEDELAQKMAQISLKNADLTAAHARAEADAASFAHREQQAKHVAEQRRKEERRDRQQMMGEREKNRLRKLKAMEGREWDAEKQEGDFRSGARHDKRGNFSGDKEDYSDGREYLYREPRSDRGRGGGRGGRIQDRVAPPKADDFPSLPPTTGSKATTDSITEGTKPSSKSWADQVEAS